RVTARLRNGLGHRHIDAVAPALSHQQAADVHAVTDKALKRCEHVHQTVAARSKRASLVIRARNRVYSFRICGRNEIPAASFAGAKATHNTDQSAVWKLSRSGFGDDLDANGRVLGQFRSARRKPVSAENERDEIRVNTSAKRTTGAVRHISADII